MFFYPFNYLNQKNTQAVAQAAEKLKQGNLPVEQILDEEELMNDLKFSNTSQLVNHLTKDHMISLLKYVIKEPERDELKTAYKYPFNSSEILSSENTFLLDKFFEDSNQDEDKYEEINDNEADNKLSDLAEQIAKQNEDALEDITEGREVGEVNEAVGNVEGKLEKLEINEVNQNETEEKQKTKDEEETNEEQEEKKKYTEESDDCANKEEEKINEVPAAVTPNEEQSGKSEKSYMPKYEVFEYFLSFLNDEKELNYVLCGYFAKIFNSLKYNRPAAVTRYLYYKKEYLHRMIHHINRKAIADTLLKTLLVEVSEIASDITVEYENQVKFEIVEKIIDSFDAHDEEKSNNICDLLSESFNNRKFAILLIKNPSIVSKLLALVITNIHSEYFKDLLKITTKLCDFFQKEIRIKINKDQGGTDQNMQNMNIIDGYDKVLSGEFDEMMPSKPVENFEIQESFYLLETLLEHAMPIVRDYTDEEMRNNQSKMHTTFDKTVNILGTRKLLEFEFVKLVFEMFSISEDHKVFTSEENEKRNFRLEELFEKFVICLIENSFFQKAIEDFFTYEWNNSFQTLFESLVTVIINSSNCGPLFEHIFIQQNLLDRIIDSCLNMKFTFNSGKFINNGYLPAVLEICSVIVSCKNENLIEIVKQNAKWNSFYDNFVEPVRRRFATGLRYDPTQEANLFKEDAMQNDNLNAMPQPVEWDITETTEKNFIESVRKIANASFYQVSETFDAFQSKPDYSDDYAMTYHNMNNVNTYDSTLTFYDNHYWGSSQLNSNQQEVDDILAELN